jgi:hypothetical protein
MTFSFFVSRGFTDCDSVFLVESIAAVAAGGTDRRQKRQ